MAINGEDVLYFTAMFLVGILVFRIFSWFDSVGKVLCVVFALVILNMAYGSPG